METSRFWDGTTVGHATDAPYEADEYSDILDIMHVIDRTSQGVFYTENAAYNGLLEVTKVDNNTVRVATGLAMNTGTVYLNNANNDLTCNVDGFYRIVLRKSWAGVGANPQTVLATALFNAGGIPAVTQTDGTTWDISLATFQRAAGVIGTITDTRYFVNAETKELFIAPTRANIVGNGWADPSVWGFEMLDGTEVDAIGNFMVPTDYISDMTLTSVVMPAANGDIYIETAATYAQCSEDYNTHNEVTGFDAITVTNNKYECIQELSITAAAVGDIVLVGLERDATDPLDTINDTVHAVGWIVSYFGRKTGGA